jgi:hypothetical protein
VLARPLPIVELLHGLLLKIVRMLKTSQPAIGTRQHSLGDNQVAVHSVELLLIVGLNISDGTRGFWALAQPRAPAEEGLHVQQRAEMHCRKEGRKEGKLEGLEAMWGIDRYGIAAPHKSENNRIFYSIFS